MGVVLCFGSAVKEDERIVFIGRCAIKAIEGREEMIRVEMYTYRSRRTWPEQRDWQSPWQRWQWR